MSTPDIADTDPPTDEFRGSRRRPLLLLAGLAVVLAALGWLFWGNAKPERMTIGTLPHVDGTLLVVEQDRLVMDLITPLDGQDVVEFTILPRDQGAFDVAHLRTHSSLGIPTRLYYEFYEGRYLGVHKVDAPLNVAPR